MLRYEAAILPPSSATLNFAVSSLSPREAAGNVDSFFSGMENLSITGIVILGHAQACCTTRRLTKLSCSFWSPTSL